MASKRRKEYLPIGNPMYRAYHEAFDHLRMNSDVLNENIKPSAHSVLNTKSNLIGLLGEIEESQEIIKLRIKNFNQKYERLQTQRRNTGYEEFKEIPANLLSELLQLHAKQDVLAEEFELIEKRIKVIDEREKVVKDAEVLTYGLKASGHFHGTRAEDPSLLNVLRDIDGQLTGFSDSGLLIIKDKRSIYNGMSVIDYRKLCNEWKKINHSFGRVSKNSLPPFPKWAVNHLAKKE